jgi:hypothetical protein
VVLRRAEPKEHGCCYIPIDGSARVNDGKRPFCPYADRVHHSNNLYIWYDYGRRHATLRCHDEQCRAQHASGWSYGLDIPPDGSEDVLAHLDAAFLASPSLHGRAGAIRYLPGDNYCEPTMRDYPLMDGGIIAIIALMGTGEGSREHHEGESRPRRQSKGESWVFSP